MVNAQVNAPATRPVQIRCAVHYVDTGDGVRYRVCQGGTPLTVPSDTSLSDHAEQQGWAVAEKELTPTPGGTAKRKLALPIHVGGAWPAAEIDRTCRVADSRIIGENPVLTGTPR